MRAEARALNGLAAPRASLTATPTAANRSGGSAGGPISAGRVSGVGSAADTQQLGPSGANGKETWSLCCKVYPCSKRLTEWTEKLWSDYVQTSPHEQRLVVCDNNLSAQRAQSWRDLMLHKYKTLTWLLPPNVTDSLQAIDSGIGQRLVALYNDEQDSEPKTSMEIWICGSQPR